MVLKTAIVVLAVARETEGYAVMHDLEGNQFCVVAAG